MLFPLHNILAVLAVLVRSHWYTAACRFRTKYNKSVGLTVNHDNRCFPAHCNRTRLKKKQNDSIEALKTETNRRSRKTLLSILLYNQKLINLFVEASGLFFLFLGKFH